ncbi:MAG: glycosyltransferase family 2 protein [Bacteroidetes bacterium]|nr:glycosyltransferase family 2 protein [Bacteroidota bacterium]
MLLYALISVRRWIYGRRPIPQLEDYSLPTLSLIVAAYNEDQIIEDKIRNTLSLVYPQDKLKIIFVTNGSTDRTPDLVRAYDMIQLLHSSERKGKIAAVHQAMKSVDTDLVVFTDANTFLNTNALKLIARHYQDAKVGAVSGEKRVSIEEQSDATAGEGFYWKYESTLKKWDSELYSVVGAAGELFSVRRSLYEPVPADTILDDFMISMQIAQKGYRTVYEPDAYAVELSSENVGEELKRKVRIAAGGIQSIVRLTALLNPFAYPVLSFQYIGHRVLRWTITPFMLFVALVTNAVLVVWHAGWLYDILLLGQLTFYGMALGGWLLERRKIKIKVLFIPYYFCIMNYAVLAGIIRYLSGKQSAAWEKSIRKSAVAS